MNISFTHHTSHRTWEYNTAPPPRQGLLTSHWFLLSSGVKETCDPSHPSLKRGFVFVEVRYDLLWGPVLSGTVSRDTSRHDGFCEQHTTTFPDPSSFPVPSPSWGVLPFWTTVVTRAPTSSLHSMNMIRKVKILILRQKDGLKLYSHLILRSFHRTPDTFNLSCTSQKVDPSDLDTGVLLVETSDPYTRKGVYLVDAYVRHYVHVLFRQ